MKPIIDPLKPIPDPDKERIQELECALNLFCCLTSLDVDFSNPMEDAEKVVAYIQEKMSTYYSQQSTINNLKKDIQHWKSAHNDLVKRNALLRERPDLPVDRLPAYEKLTNDNEHLKSMLRGIISHWYEFGGEYGLDELIDAADRHLKGLPPLQYECNL